MSLSWNALLCSPMTPKTEIPAEVAGRRVQELREEIERTRQELNQLTDELEWWMAGRKFFGPSQDTGANSGVAEAKPTLREAIRRVMSERPTSTWPAERVIEELRGRSWLPSGKNAEHTVRSMLANMKNQNQLKRVGRGRYRLAPSEEEA
jgi:hypothetical protein